MSDPINPTMTPLERQAAWIQNGMNPDHAEALNQFVTNPGAATDHALQLHLAEALGMSTGGASLIVGRQQPQAPQAAGTVQQPQTTAPPNPNTVPPTFNGVADPNRQFVDDNYVFQPDGVTVGDVRKKLDDPSTSAEDKQFLQDRYGLREADPPAGAAADAQKPMTLPVSRLADFITRSAGPGIAATASALNAATATNWQTRNSPAVTPVVSGAAQPAGLLSLVGTLRSGSTVGLGGAIAASSAQSAFSMAGLSGPAFTMSKVVRSISSSYSDSSFIQMLHSNLPIESLLYYWMSYASDKYDKKLREKMEEWTMQTQLEDQMETNKSIANSVGGILGLAAGPLASSAIQAAVGGLATTANTYLSATSGTGKSSTVLAQEVQILVQQWKTITDMTSNLQKDINDMAMTAVRNLR